MRTAVFVFAPQVAIRAAVARALMPLGYRVEVASSEKAARQLAGKERFAAAVVAPRSAATDDFALIHELRDAADKLVLLADNAETAERLAQSFPEALICSSQPLEQSKFFAFLANSMEKPPHPAVASRSELLRFEGRTLDVPGRVLLDADGRELALTRGEFAMLVAFARNPGQVLSRATLRHAVGGGSVDAYDRSIDMLVARLRRKIEPKPAKPRFIITVPGIGYKFGARVELNSAMRASRAQLDQIGNAADAPRVERRQITVLSCQILGFAELAAKLDPEDLQYAIHPVYAACADIIGRFGGTMLRTAGDDVLAYFGFPKARENDAESAVRAALELLRVVRTIEATPIGKFRVRIGIATGLVVISESPSGTAQPTAIGAALNLALHMQKAAPADGVVIAAATRDLIGHFFLCEEIQPVELEEQHEPAPAWRVIEALAGMPRFEALRRDGMLDLVGRQAELQRLQHCWSQAVGGAGQVILVMGEAGIGKSRLAIELQERLCKQPHAALRYWGSPYRTDAPMAVLIDELQRSASFAAGDAVACKVEKLQAEFTLLGPGADEAVALGCGLLGLPFDESLQVAQLSPQKRKERTFAVLLARIEALTARHPVLAVVEDVHWVDPTSLEFIGLLVERASGMRLLLVIVARPEFVPPWPEYSYLTTVALPRLSHADSALLIQQVAGDRRIADDTEADIVARADGVPLFVEELTKSVLENTSDSGNGRALGPSAAGSAPIPSTLHGLLLDRLDRLDRGKAVAQAGAVIGREFSYELLSMISGLDEGALRSGLDQFVSSGLVFRRGHPPHAAFTFKHAMVRDAAYAMLPRERRQTLHASAAKAYENHSPETVEAQPELLAYHFRQGGMPAEAIAYLIAAADRALLRSATVQALFHLARARELIDALPSTRALRRDEIKLQVLLANALMPTRGHSAPETKAAAERARLLIEQAEALGESPEDPILLFSVLFSLWLASYNADNRDEACEFAAQLLALAEKKGKTAPLMIGHRVMGISLLSAGDITESRAHLNRAIALYDRGEHRSLVTRFSVESGVVILAFRSRALWLLGYPEAALADAEHALKAARQIGQAATLLSALTFGSLTLVDCGDYAKATVQLDEGAALANEKGALFWNARGMMTRGCLLALTGKAAEAVEMITTGMATYRSTGAITFVPFYLSYLALAYAELGQFDDARSRIDEAMTAVEAAKERWCEAEIHRIAGEIELKSPQAEAAKAEAHFAHALAVARAQQARSLELRAAIGIARLWRDRGRRQQARELLAGVSGWFTEGFDTLDLRKAKGLLDTLASIGLSGT
jgi:predicted ATPase/class 3 adenylate cyclase/DNA-binding response OmpR family regulator